MDKILSALSGSEIETVMAVLKRDNMLREREHKRVARLGIELVKEKRQGALVVNDQQKNNAIRSRCARCRKFLPATAKINPKKWRCCVCKHLVCKNCRFVRHHMSELENIMTQQPTGVKEQLSGSAEDERVLDEDIYIDSDHHDADVSSSETQYKSYSSFSGDEDDGDSDHDNSPSDQNVVLKERLSCQYSTRKNLVLEDANCPGSKLNSSKSVDSCSITPTMIEDESESLLFKGKGPLQEDDQNRLRLGEIKKKKNLTPETCSNVGSIIASESESETVVEITDPPVGFERATQGKINSRPLELGNSEKESEEEKQKEIMRRFLNMAGVKNPTKDLSALRGSFTSVSTPNKSIEKKLFASSTIKTLALLSKSPFKLASKILNDVSPLEKQKSFHFPAAFQKTLLQLNSKEYSREKSSENVDKRGELKSDATEIIEGKMENVLDKNDDYDVDGVEESCDLRGEYDNESSGEKEKDELFTFIESGNIKSSPCKNSANALKLSEKQKKLLIWQNLVDFSEKIGSNVYNFNQTEGCDPETSEDSLIDEEDEGFADAESEEKICVILSRSPLTSLSKYSDERQNRFKTTKTLRSRQVERKRRRFRLKAMRQSNAKRKGSSASFSKPQILVTLESKHIASATNDFDTEKEDNRSISSAMMEFAAKNIFTKVRGLAKTMREGNQETIFWVCRVCQKTMELRKKSGSWFHKASTAAALSFKQSLLRESSSPERSRASTLMDGITIAQNRESTRLRSSLERSGSWNNFSQSELTTAPCTQRRNSADATHLPTSYESKTHQNRILQVTATDGFSGSTQNFRSNCKLQRATVSKAIHDNLRKYSADLPDDLRTKRTRYHSSFSRTGTLNIDSGSTSVLILDGPEDCKVVKGFPISLCCVFKAAPPAIVTWKKENDEIKHSSACHIETTSHTTALTILKSEPGDSGCYSLKVANRSEFDQYFVNVQVVEVPPPPSKPQVEVVSGKGVSVFWTDSNVAEFLVEMRRIYEKKRKTEEIWNEVGRVELNTCLVTGVQDGGVYAFRTIAIGDHGLSLPSPTSDQVQYFDADSEASNVTKGENEFGAQVKMKQGELSSFYVLKEELWRGNFGNLHKVVDDKSGREFAVKLFLIHNTNEKSRAREIVGIVNQLRHSQLIELVDAYQNDRQVAMVMNLINNVMLLDVISSDQYDLTEAKCVHFAREICDGLKYIHSLSIVHLNIEPRTILCTNSLSVKIVGFGSARKLPITTNITFRSHEFSAPELINCDEICAETDAWSFGIICCYMLSGLSPIKESINQSLSPDLLETLFDNKRFNHVSKTAKDFLSSLIVQSQKKRANPEEAMKHAWLSGEKKMKKRVLDTRNLKEFLIDYKKKIGELQSMSEMESNTSATLNSKNSSELKKEESLGGILQTLRGKFVREKTKEQFYTVRRPSFEETFDDIEVVTGASARFKCVISESSNADIEWHKDGNLIKSSSRYRISFEEGNVCSLFIPVVEASDEAEYTCSVKNPEGTAHHSAELIVISPDS